MQTTVSSDNNKRMYSDILVQKERNFVSPLVNKFQTRAQEY